MVGAGDVSIWDFSGPRVVLRDLRPVPRRPECHLHGGRELRGLRDGETEADRLLAHVHCHTHDPRRTHRQVSMPGRLIVVLINSNIHPLNGPLSRTTRVSWYQKGKTNLDFTEARDSECQWQQLGHMQVCTSLQTDNHISTPPLSLLQAGCPSCRPTNSVKALKALLTATAND